MNILVLIGKKQFFLKIGDTFYINKINGLISETIIFNKILFFQKNEKNQDQNIINFIGKPFLNIFILAKLISIKKTKKIEIIKFKRRKNYFKKQGHRQILMQFLVLDIKYKKEYYGT